MIKSEKIKSADGKTIAIVVKANFGKNGVNWELKLVSDRFPMKNKRANIRLARDLSQIATRWEIPFAQESSLWPSVAGTVPASSGVVCGIGPVAKNLYTPQEAVLRISLLQRTLLLTQFLAQGMLGHKTD